MGQKNTQLREDIASYVARYPGQNRRRIATGLQRTGNVLGKSHIINTISELVDTGVLKEVTTQDGRRVIVPAGA